MNENVLGCLAFAVAVVGVVAYVLLAVAPHYNATADLDSDGCPVTVDDNEETRAQSASRLPVIVRASRVLSIPPWELADRESEELAALAETADAARVYATLARMARIVYKRRDVCGPHCDDKVLHAPGVCLYCDDFPAVQRFRQILRVNFTGETDADKFACPATVSRDIEKIHAWGGNSPTPHPDPLDGVSLGDASRLFRRSTMSARQKIEFVKRFGLPAYKELPE